MVATVDPGDLYQIIYTDHPDPFRVLGAHPAEIAGQQGISVRAFLPDASGAHVVERTASGESRHSMTMLHPYGFFEHFLPGRDFPFSYELEREDEYGHSERFLDSYAFMPTLSDFDLHLFGEGKNYRIFQKLGAHPLRVDGVDGIQFAVWAPAAKSVSVIGTFNNWDRRRHAMRRLDSGVWEIFIPGLPEGELYKFQIKTVQGHILDKTDPFAFRTQVAPRTASIVHRLGRYSWGDEAWMAERRKRDPRSSPMSIYEVHLGSWQRTKVSEILTEDRPLNYRELAETLVPYVKEMGYTHVEMMPVMEHPFGGSWGYEVTGYYAPSSRWGMPEDLMALIDAFHQVGIGVILDWVPAHFPKDAHGLGRFDGTGTYEHIDPRQGEHRDWDTFIFNYGRNEVRNFLIGSALFWFEYYHADGIRVDAVASMLYLDYSRKQGEWIPNRYGGRENLEAIEFLKELNHMVRELHPGACVIAEESTAWPSVTRPDHLGGLGFDFKWNMGWMHDTLAYMAQDPVFRKYHHGKLTFSIWYAFSEAFVLPLSHDEVVHMKKALISKMPGDYWQQFANTRLLFAYQYGHPGKKLLFMGSEFGQWREWSDDRSLDWNLVEYPSHRGLRQLVMDLNRLYRAEPALWQVDHDNSGFEWVDLTDAEASVIAFLRKGLRPDDTLLFVCNFTPVARYDYRVGVGQEGSYLELLNSDAEVYGGSNLGNAGRVDSVPVPSQGRPYSISLVLPPLAAVVLKREKREVELRLEEEETEEAPEAPDEAGTSEEEQR
ncbi:MAG: 1,4-alpha-glucan branching protein GlgB [Acidobacteriota bacterium]